MAAVFFGSQASSTVPQAQHGECCFHPAQRMLACHFSVVAIDEHLEGSATIGITRMPDGNEDMLQGAALIVVGNLLVGVCFGRRPLKEPIRRPGGRVNGGMQKTGRDGSIGLSVAFSAIDQAAQKAVVVCAGGIVRRPFGFSGGKEFPQVFNHRGMLAGGY